jgi:PhnB protein
MKNNEAVFTKDTENKKLTVVRPFNAPLAQVWSAWTTGEMLDKWWAPKPYKAETKLMDFKEGGRWLYKMVAPAGDGNWCRVDFNIINQQQLITSAVMFCDEEGNEDHDFPKMYWTQVFNQTPNGTTVTIEITFGNAADMDTILQMGFEQGFTAGLNNLDEYLGGN